MLQRPKFQLRSLPIPIRWEATRRHPYYQLHWKSASRFYAGATSNELEYYSALSSATILAQIGVTSTLPDPQLEFDVLNDRGLTPAWLSGAVHPITFRGMTGILIAALPSDTLARLAELFARASASATFEVPFPRDMELMELLRLPATALDTMPDEPFVSINPAASERQIREALTPLLKQWKVERQIGERRDRSEKFEAYFVAWDRREGFANGTYDPRQEKTLKEVAQGLQLPLDTTENHYRRAFELITGHVYAPEKWYQAFGLLKLGNLINETIGHISRKRPIQNRTLRDVPQAKLGAPVVSESVAPDAGEVEQLSLFHDICTLIRKGKPNDAIADELELSAASLIAMDAIRRHLGLP